MRASPWPLRVALLTLGAACVVVVSVYGELSGQSLVAVGLTGTVLAAVGLAGRAGEAAAPVGSRGAAWSAWLVAALAWELTTLADPDLPTLSDLCDPVLAHPWVRGAATAGWLVAGAWLLDRPRDRGEAP